MFHLIYQIGNDELMHLCPRPAFAPSSLFGFSNRVVRLHPLDVSVNIPILHYIKRGDRCVSAVLYCPSSHLLST